ncbi:hypothetical protein Tco_1227774 [Tanacetum coccineum]
MISMMLRLVFSPWRGVTDWHQSLYLWRIMSPPARASRAKFHWGITFATGRKQKLTKKQVGRKWILVREMMMISKDGEISEFPEYHSSGEEEPTEQPRALNKYRFVDHPELQRNKFAPY